MNGAPSASGTGSAGPGRDMEISAFHPGHFHAALAEWKDVNMELPQTIALVRAFNGRNVQKCFYDRDEKVWRNQRGEIIQVIKWKKDE